MGNRSTSLLMEWWIETRRCFPKWIPSSLCNFSRSLTLKTPPLKLHYPTPLYRRPFIGIWNVLFVFIHSKWLLWWILVEGGKPNSLLWKRFPEIKRKRVKVISISLLLPLPTSLSLFLPLSLSLSLSLSQFFSCSPLFNSEHSFLSAIEERQWESRVPGEWWVCGHSNSITCDGWEPCQTAVMYW